MVRIHICFQKKVQISRTIGKNLLPKFKWNLKFKIHIYSVIYPTQKTIQVSEVTLLIMTLTGIMKLTQPRQAATGLDQRRILIASVSHDRMSCIIDRDFWLDCILCKKEACDVFMTDLLEIPVPLVILVICLDICCTCDTKILI